MRLFTLGSPLGLAPIIFLAQSLLDFYWWPHTFEWLTETLMPYCLRLVPHTKWFICLTVELLPDFYILTELSFVFPAEIPKRYARIKQCLYSHHKRHHHQPGLTVDGSTNCDHLHVQSLWQRTSVWTPSAESPITRWARSPTTTGSHQKHRYHRWSEEKRWAGM